MNVFNTLTLKQIFWKTKTLFKKLEYRFLVETLRLKMHHFEWWLNRIITRMMTTKWTYRKERSCTSSFSTASFFRKFCFSLRTSCKESIWCTSNPNVQNLTFCKRWSFIWRCFFPVCIIKSDEWIFSRRRLNEI